MAARKREKHAPEPGREIQAALPGEGAVENALLDEAVADLNRIYVSKGLETARSVGDYALAKFFDGDPAKFKTRGNGHVSFRELGKRQDLQFGWQFIWNSVAVVTQAKQLPAEVVEALPLSHHKLLLTVKDDGDRKELAKLAVDEKLSKRDLEDRIKAARVREAEGDSKVGRPPLPGFVKAFTALKKVVKTATEDEITEASFEHFGKDEAGELLKELEAQIAELTGVAGKLRAHLGG